MLLAQSTCKSCNKSFERKDFRLDSKGHIKERICKDCLKLRAKTIPLANGRRPDIYGVFKSSSCANCGFEGLSCQLDVDHIDGDFNNNQPNNLQTLCANCHRLKTYLTK